jgi:hypothetical protein
MPMIRLTQGLRMPHPGALRYRYGARDGDFIAEADTTEIGSPKC